MLLVHAWLLAAAVVWTFVHLGVSGTRLRTFIVRAIGEAAFRGVFSLASVTILVWLVWSYRIAGPVQVLWVTPHWLIVLSMLLMLPALVLFVGSVTVPNPTMVQSRRALATEIPARGVLRVTRHPMLWSFAIWAFVHLIMVGTLGATIFFGAFLTVALAGMPSLDAKISGRGLEGWPAFMQATSIVPFIAIAQGRNRLDIAEIGFWRIAAALAAWFVLIALHPVLFHVAAWSYLQIGQ